VIQDGDTLPRMPKRQGGQKRKLLTDDLITLYTIGDERNLSNSLPSFVAKNLSRIPFMNIDSVNTLSLAKKMEDMENRLKHVESSLVKQPIYDEVPCQEMVSAVRAVPPLSACVQNGQTTVSDDDSDTGTVVANNGTWADNSEWQTVRYRHQKKSSSGRTTAHGLTAHGLKKDTGNGSRKIIGCRSANDSSLKAGVQIIQKAVMHIDNLHPDCTEALLKDYLLACEVQVITCYPAKSWLRGEERDNVTAFRVCVPADDKHKICDPELWSTGVIIRDWKFTSKK